MRFRLVSQHYINDQLLPADTIVGDGENAIAYSGPPSMMMEPLDAEAKEAAKKIAQKRRPEAITPPTTSKTPIYAGGAAKTIQKEEPKAPTLSPLPQGQAPIKN